MTRVLCFIAMTLLIAGCASGPSSEEVMRSHGYSSDYTDGYHAGCNSGKHAGGDSFTRRERNDAAYQSNREYRSGWDYGFLSCKEQEIRDLQVATTIGIIAAAATTSSHGADGIDAHKALEGVDTSAIQAAGW